MFQKLKSPRPSSSSAEKSPAFNFRPMHEAIPRASSSLRKPEQTPRSTTRKPEQTPRSKSTSIQAEPRITNLPLDVLVKCFLKLQSVFEILSCAEVCRVWRDASLFDVLWKEMYIRWHSDDQLPSGCSSWREAFVHRFEKGRSLAFEREVNRSLEAGLLQRHQNNLLDFKPGVSFKSFAEDLHLEFYMRINNGQQFRLKGRQAVVFPSSCILHCPFNSLKRKMKLSSLTSMEVLVSSGKLAKSYPVSQLKLGKNAKWRINESSTPVRLLQHGGSSACNLIVGTLLESPDSSSIEHEEVVFIKFALHLAEAISKFFASCLVNHRLIQDPDPTYGLHGYHAIVQLHTFNKLLWSRSVEGAFWDQRESILGEIAVLLLIPSFEVVSSKLSLPWRSEAFSGETENSLVATITLWDIHTERVWQAVDIFQLKPVTLPCVEYGLPEFEGFQLEATISDAKRGISVSMRCSVPMYDNAGHLFAITDLRLSLTRSFLQSWFGVSNI